MSDGSDAVRVGRRTVEIEWGHCDAAGIVYYPNYFAMFDTSTIRLFDQALGMTKFHWTRRYGILGIPLVDARARFLVPSRYGDVVTIESRLTGVRRSSFDVEHRMLRADGALAIEATETRVWAGRHPDDPDRIRGVPIPPEVVARLA